MNLGDLENLRIISSSDDLIYNLIHSISSVRGFLFEIIGFYLIIVSTLLNFHGSWSVNSTGLNLNYSMFFPAVAVGDFPLSKKLL